MNLPDINNSLDKAARGILDFLMPRRCPFCGAVAGKKLLCEHCSETLPFTGEHAVEERPLPGVPHRFIMRGRCARRY